MGMQCRGAGFGLLLSTAMVAWAFSPSGAALAEPARSEHQTFRITPQPLGLALRQFASQANIQLLFTEAEVSGKRAPAIEGSYTRDEVIRRLLEGSGLIFETPRPDVVVVRHARQHADASRPAGAVQISAAADVSLVPAAPRQVAQAPAAGPAAAAPGLEEILVTARRREENLQRVPVAVTAVSGEDIRTRGVQSVADLRLITPSLNVTAVRTGQENFIIRGQGPGPLDAGSYPGVQTYFAEVPAFTAGPGLYYDLQSVQVLKGPQGTLFGRNVLGGAVLFQPRKPTEQVEGYLQGTFGNYGRREGEGAINLPVVEDKVKLRLAGIVTRRNGYARNLTTAQRLDPRDYESARASVTLTPVDWLESYTVADWFHQKGAGQATILEGVNPAAVISFFPGLVPALQAQLARQQARGPRIAEFDALTELKNLNRGIANITTATLGDGLTLKNVMGYRDTRQRLLYDLDGSPFPLLQTAPAPDWFTRANQFTEELQLQGQSFDNRLNWIGGAYYEFVEGKNFTRASDQFFSRVFQRPSNQNVSRALFAQGTFALAEWLNLTAGIRYTWDRRSSISNTESAAGTCQQIGADAQCHLAVGRKFRAPTWNVSVDYQVSPGTMLYATTRRGYKSGGLNAVSNSPQYLFYGPETATDVELGVKADTRAGTMPLRANASVFHTWNKDRQFQGSVLVNGQLTSVIQSAGNARVKGAELELTLIPTEALELSGFYSYTRYKLVNSALLANYTPQHKAGATARLHVPVPKSLGDLVLTGTYSWQSLFYFTADASEPIKSQKAYGLLNMRLDLNDVGGYPADIGIFATNLTDKAYRTGGFPLFNGVGVATTIFSEPRMWGVQLRYRFGG